MPAGATDPDLARLYRETRERVVAVVSGLDDEALDRQVPACPLWSARDVLAHLTAVAEDAVAGRLTGVPTEAETALQVARFRGRPGAGDHRDLDRGRGCVREGRREGPGLARADRRHQP